MKRILLPLTAAVLTSACTIITAPEQVSIVETKSSLLTNSDTLMEALGFTDEAEQQTSAEANNNMAQSVHGNQQSQSSNNRVTSPYTYPYGS